MVKEIAENFFFTLENIGSCHGDAKNKGHADGVLYGNGPPRGGGP
jgi:hypothetical protein